jgi:hypothetical protein
MMILSVEESAVGDRIRFTNPDAGWYHDIATSKEAGLIVGQVYVISKIEVHSWHTKVWLENFGGPFNSVQFRVDD